MNLYSYETWSTEGVASAIVELRGKLSVEKDEILAEHYKLRMDAARRELAKRNAAEIIKLANEQLS